MFNVLKLNSCNLSDCALFLKTSDWITCPPTVSPSWTEKSLKFLRHQTNDWEAYVLNHNRLQHFHTFLWLHAEYSVPQPQDYIRIKSPTLPKYTYQSAFLIKTQNCLILCLLFFSPSLYYLYDFSKPCRLLTLITIHSCCSQSSLLYKCVIDHTDDLVTA